MSPVPREPTAIACADAASTVPDPAVESGPSAAAGEDYTVAVSLNQEPFSIGGYHTGNTMAVAADGRPLRLIFHAERFTDDCGNVDVRHVADAVCCLSDGHGEDDHRQEWPAGLPPLSVGDIVAVTAPSGKTVHLSIGPGGFTRVPTHAL